MPYTLIDHTADFVPLLFAVGVATVLGGVAAAMQIIRYAMIARLLELRLWHVALPVAIPVAAGVVSVTVATLTRGCLGKHAFLQAAVAGPVAACVYAAVLLLCSRFMDPSPVYLLMRARDTAVAKLAALRK